ncbi:MAG: oligopeptide:H+ symporter [Phycisphaerales bacterium]|nr:oligopeptide:H+ symporter [Phycisphaerales bacterium]
MSDTPGHDGHGHDMTNPDVIESRGDKPPFELTPDQTTGHPPGLWVLFITEMWERFSYYGMRALFVLFLIGSVDKLVPIKSQSEELVANTNPGFGWGDGNAYSLYAVYTFMAYLTSILGGVVADRFLGTHRSMIVGGWIIALGHICLACMAFFPFELGTPVSLDHGSGALMAFLLGCSLIVIGTGFFKPCVSVMVGQLYGEGDARRDSGFTIFYMGINLGAFFSPLVAGWLASRVGWHWGFGSAAVGMLAGLACYQMLRPRYLKGIGLAPEVEVRQRSKGLVALMTVGVLAIPLLPLALFVFGGLDDILSGWAKLTASFGVWRMAGTITGLLLASCWVFLILQKPAERSRLAVILILAFIGNIFFWTAFEQAGSTLNVFAERNTDRTIWGLLEDGFPAAFYQSVNPLAILIFAPIFSWLWLFLARRKKDPSTPMKFAIGLWLLGLGFLAMVFGALRARNGELTGPHWLLITYVVTTWGELCLSPVGLSMVTKLAPKRLQSLMMGLWFFSLALSNLSAGLVARYSVDFVSQDGEPAKKTFLIDGLPGFFLMLVLFPIAAGVLIFVISPWIKKLMRGVH